jgi:hypothetical protein
VLTLDIGTILCYNVVWLGVVWLGLAPNNVSSGRLARLVLFLWS